MIYTQNIISNKICSGLLKEISHHDVSLKQAQHMYLKEISKPKTERFWCALYAVNLSICLSIHPSIISLRKPF